jgi:hypothetical protein
LRGDYNLTRFLRDIGLSGEKRDRLLSLLRLYSSSADTENIPFISSYLKDKYGNRVVGCKLNDTMPLRKTTKG